MNSLLPTRGASFMDVIIGIFMITVAFFALFAVFRLATQLVGNTRARISAVALANEQMEFIRSLAYDDVGTVSGIPAGNIEQEELVSLNNATYTRRTFIQYVDAPEDGLGVADTNSITADYKRAKVELLWQNRRGATSTFATVTNIVPRGIETLAGGGTLIINVLDSLAAPITNAEVNIYNASTSPTVDVDTFTNTTGQVIFPGSPAASAYEVTVTKAGMSTARTYPVSATNTNPNPGHLTVVAGDVTSSTFLIDTLGRIDIRTFLPIGAASWSDLFDDTVRILSTASTTVAGGDVTLTDFGSGYEPQGNVFSVNIEPVYLASWTSMSWNDATPPNTDILYRVYFHNGTNWAVIPDLDLPGNSTGTSTSPIDVSGLATTTYDRLQLAGFLSTADASSTPTLHDWLLTYQAGPTPQDGVAFWMRGAKTIGTAGGGPVYKYANEALVTDSSGVEIIADLEWDNYSVFFDDATTGYDVAEFCDASPPSTVALNPGATVVADVLLEPDTPHTLLVDVRDGVGVPLPGATARLFRLPYDTTQTTSACGQTFFNDNVPEGEVATADPYNLDVSLAGYTTQNLTNVDVTGSSTISVVLTP